MAAEALYAARLLSGEMPEADRGRLRSSPVGCSLFPADEGDLRTALLVSRLGQPVQAHRRGPLPARRALRRGPVPDVPAARAQPGRDRRGAARAPRWARTTRPVRRSKPVAEPDLSTFWSAPPQTEEVALHFALPESDALPVKRLGPPPFVRDQAGGHRGHGAPVPPDRRVRAAAGAGRRRLHARIAG